MTDVAKFRAVLENRQKELEALLQEIDEELDSHQSKDWEELAVEREGDEVLERRGTDAQAEIAKIKAAMARMDEDEFGYCVDCGDEVAAERLEIVPHTPFCSKCAAKHG
ncbi:TraR/DksA family transcriptional regulator [Aliiroseovarius subalbicans]|uniref:TraR/DksA family transcriptional regulator n=1 Tax=Aliiroseovarius subalbicans TaxID=2925840 RepID=UPI001F5AEE52|nr:TraR/DksA family transcriptional regulator [Aliiroseovarius subalbicans]MCI2398996.1 TraR/DksA family transcriptional regulator [Aliiroseovarius subalbicans]